MKPCLLEMTTSVEEPVWSFANISDTADIFFLKVHQNKTFREIRTVIKALYFSSDKNTVQRICCTYTILQFIIFIEDIELFKIINV